jgi:hypothetical protein
MREWVPAACAPFLRHVGGAAENGEAQCVFRWTTFASAKVSLATPFWDMKHTMEIAKAISSLAPLRMRISRSNPHPGPHMRTRFNMRLPAVSAHRRWHGTGRRGSRAPTSRSSTLASMAVIREVEVSQQEDPVRTSVPLSSSACRRHMAPPHRIGLDHAALSSSPLLSAIGQDRPRLCSYSLCSPSLLKSSSPCRSSPSSPSPLKLLLLLSPLRYASARACQATLQRAERTR